jgi:nitrate reductase alpha subunit
MDSTTLSKAYQRARKSSPATATEDRYRDQWRWDKTARATHCVDCYPGNCPMRVYIRDGKVVREEQAGDLPVIERGVPDANPMGCQKGACWSQTLDGEDRIHRPLRRAGERGEGRWEEISWDEALAELADAMLDAIQDKGPESIVGVQGAEAATWGIVGSGRLLNMLGGIVTDVNAEINDFSPGIYLTFNVCSSLDDWFHAELILIFQCNPTYTVNASQHYILESRYNGGEFVMFAPDCSPSTQYADYHLPAAGASRNRCRLGAGDVQGHHRRGNLRLALRQGPDGSAPVGPHRQQVLPAGRGPGGGRQLRAVLLLRRAFPPGGRGAAQHPRLG